MATTTLIERLKKRNFKLTDWIVEDVIRISGLCACLRDEKYGLSKKKILKELKKYDKEQAKERAKKLNPKYPPLVSDKQLKKQYNKMVKRINKELPENLELQKKVYNCIDNFKKIKKSIPKREHTIIVINLIREVENQLNIAKEDVDWQVKWYKEQKKKYSTFDAFVREEEENRKREMRYLLEEKKDAERELEYSYAEDYQKIVELFCKGE